MLVVAKCLHFVMPYMNQNKQRRQTLESAQYGLKTESSLTVEHIRSLIGFLINCDFLAKKLLQSHRLFDALNRPLIISFKVYSCLTLIKDFFIIELFHLIGIGWSAQLLHSPNKCNVNCGEKSSAKRTRSNKRSASVVFFFNKCFFLWRQMSLIEMIRHLFMLLPCYACFFFLLFKLFFYY